LGITEPDKWSDHAYYAATRIFASCLSADLAQRFFNLVLLPRVVKVCVYVCVCVSVCCVYTVSICIYVYRFMCIYIYI